MSGHNHYYMMNTLILARISSNGYSVDVTAIIPRIRGRCAYRRSDGRYDMVVMSSLCPVDIYTTLNPYGFDNRCARFSIVLASELDALFSSDSSSNSIMTPVVNLFDLSIYFVENPIIVGGYYACVRITALLITEDGVFAYSLTSRPAPNDGRRWKCRASRNAVAVTIDALTLLQYVFGEPSVDANGKFFCSIGTLFYAGSLGRDANNANAIARDGDARRGDGKIWKCKYANPSNSGFVYVLATYGACCQIVCISGYTPFDVYNSGVSVTAVYSCGGNCASLWSATGALFACRSSNQASSSTPGGRDSIDDLYN